MMEAWIQSKDFTSKEFKNSSEEQALELFINHNWQEELVDFDEYDENQCPPGLGLIHSNGSILHLCPNQDISSVIHYSYTEAKKLLGFIPSNNHHNFTALNVSKADSLKLITLHYKNDREAILTFIKGRVDSEFS
ncbi:MAG: hypothetical protein NE334_21990 [Lentisphaeraceae bacterium]|nr:hypothetical protein [Lentisphaeraceae bacterium]